MQCLYFTFEAAHFTLSDFLTKTFFHFNYTAVQNSKLCINIILTVENVWVMVTQN